MNFIETGIPGVWIIESVPTKDARGYFMESYKASEFEKYIGRIDFIQENESCSAKGVVRGLHYQLNPYPQAKLVRVIKGKVLDVAVDIRKGSPAYGKYIAVELSEDNKRQFYIPRGFAHGFQVLSDEAVFIYKVDNLYKPEYEACIRFDDPTVNVSWHDFANEKLILSEKDMNAPFLSDAKNNFNYS